MSVEKTPEQIQAEVQKKLVEERQEKTVITVRDRILPILKTKNLSIDQSKLVCDLLAVAIQQGQFMLLEKHKIEDLKLLDFIQESYPQSETVKEIVNDLNSLTMLEGVSALQWMVAKINKIIEDENKERKFEELKLDF